METNELVTAHYGRPGLLDDILAACQRAGLESDDLTAHDLAPVDEFHLGGLTKTRELLARLDLDRGWRLLDVGSGIGGPARVAAGEFGCRVTGVDLTPEFTATARALTDLVGLSDSVSFETADASQLPFPDGSFDGATMIHVGMNLPDKAAVFQEVRRVLKAGSTFLVFDQMQADSAAPTFPCPWARDPEASALASPADYRRLLTRAGFEVVLEEDHTVEGIEFFRGLRAAAAEVPPPVLGLDTMFGDEWPERARNNAQALENGTLVAVLMMARAV